MMAVPFKGSRMDSVLFSLIPADLGSRSSRLLIEVPA